MLSWSRGPDEDLEGTDLVLFLTVGLNHIPRPEDWPVMPAEHLRVRGYFSLARGDVAYGPMGNRSRSDPTAFLMKIRACMYVQGKTRRAAMPL